MRLLLAAGARVDAADASGQTALHWAAVRGDNSESAGGGNLAAAEELLRAGASVEAADERGYRPVHVAAQHGQVRFLARLVLGVGGGGGGGGRTRDGGDDDDKGGEQAMTGSPSSAAADPEPSAISAPPSALADFDARDADGRTPLHWSAYKGHADCARLLLALGASPRAPDNERATPLHWVSF